MPAIGLLTIGINYSGQLQGCIRDSNNIKQYFAARGPLAACVQMIDTPGQSELYPSRANIEAQLVNMVARAAQFTHIIVHYSGHGSQTRDRNGDEADGKDELLVPADYISAGFISDDWLLQNVVLRLPSTVCVLFIIDACHSGTMLDLRYNWVPALRGGGFARKTNNPRCTERPNVTLISGCLDSQYSYETSDSTYGISGALTSAFLNAIATRSSRAPSVVLFYIKQFMQNRLQTPQISSTQKTITPWNYIL